MNLLVLIGIGSYMVIMIGIGFWSSKQIRTLADFIVAGRRLSYPFAVATLFATWFGAGTCMGAAGTAYSKGLLGVVADPFAAGVSLIIAGVFYVSLLRRLKLLTITDVFGLYYSKSSEIFASFLMVPVYIGWLGSQMVALGYLLNVIIGIPALLGIVLSGIIIVIYTFAGGMWAVTLTDVIQVVILIVGLLILFPVAIHQIGGLNVLISSMPDNFWHFIPRSSDYQSWMTYLGQWALLGLGTCVGQDLIQRSLASRNETVAKTSAISAGFLYIIIGSIPVLLGFAGRIIFPDIADPELILPSLATKFLPPLGLTLFLGALLAAIMSSADSALLAASSLVTKNIIIPLSKKTNNQQTLRWTRISTIVIAILAMSVALYVKEIYNLMVNSWATLFVAILVPVTAALYWKKANTLAAWTSMIMGTGSWLGIIFFRTGNLQEIADPLFYEAAVYGGLVSFLSYLLVTLSRKSLPKKTPAFLLPKCED